MITAVNKKYTADKNIVVYRVYLLGGRDPKTNETYKTGEVQEATFGIGIIEDPSTCEAFSVHQLRYYEELIGQVDLYCAVGHTSHLHLDTAKHQLNLFTDENSSEVRKCLIPKGATYFMDDEENYITSDQIVMTEEVIYQDGLVEILDSLQDHDESE